MHCLRWASKKGKHSVRTVILNHFKASFYQSIYEKCGYSQLKLIRTKMRREKSLNKSCGALRMNNFAACLMARRANRTKKSGRHTHIHITLSTFIGISWRHFVVCCALLLSLFSFAAADEFQIRRHIVFEVVATRRFQFFVSRDCIFVDLFKQ